MSAPAAISSDLLAWVADWAQILSVIGPPIFVWILWSVKKWAEGLLKNMHDTVNERTAPIQKGANGGWSLPDAIRLLGSVDNKLDKVHERIDGAYKNLRENENRLEHLRGRFETHVEDTK